MISSISPVNDGKKSLILLRNGEFIIKEMSPYNFIQRYYREHCVSYEGGRKVTCKVLGIRQKAPVCLSQYKGIIFFPTHSPTNRRCSFLNVANIRKVSTYRKRETKVEFIHNYVIFPIGIRSIRKQIDRCDKLIYRKIDLWKI